jgi:hypothetical protein
MEKHHGPSLQRCPRDPLSRPETKHRSRPPRNSARLAPPCICCFYSTRVTSSTTLSHRHSRLARRFGFEHSVPILRSFLHFTLVGGFARCVLVMVFLLFSSDLIPDTGSSLVPRITWILRTVGPSHRYQYHDRGGQSECVLTPL